MPTDQLQVKTTRFGLVEVNADQLITFPHGLLGFEELHDYFFHPVPGNPAFRWMQAVSASDVAFLLVDPFIFFPDYAVEISPQQEQELDVGSPQEVLVYTTVTIPAGRTEDITTNLAGPLVFNPHKRLGLQVVMGEPYTTKHRLFNRPPRPAAEAGA